MGLENIGKVGKYTPKPRVVTPHEEHLFVKDTAALKVYDMFEMNGEGLPPRTEDGASYSAALRHQIGKRLRSGEIDPRIGLGFSIISEGMLNVGMWGTKDYPSVLTQNVYSFDVKDPRTLAREILDEAGTACAWETEIIGHEGAAWQRLLRSPDRDKEPTKRAYLNDTFRGATSDVYLMDPEKVKVKDLGLSKRARDGLRKAGIDTVRQLAGVVKRHSSDYIERAFKQVGPETTAEYVEQLRRFGLYDEKEITEDQERRVLKSFGLRRG